MESPNCAGRVLVVDENSDQLFLMTRWLRQAGFRVCSVSTAKAADDMLALQPPELVGSAAQEGVLHAPNFLGASLAALYDVDVLLCTQEF